MNQILVTEKIYITPELKRKKKIYKFIFIFSIILIIILFSLYAYAEYDRNKSEEVSQDILASMNTLMDDSNSIDSTTISRDNEVWIIALDGGGSSEPAPVVQETTNERFSCIKSIYSCKWKNIYNSRKYKYS